MAAVAVELTVLEYQESGGPVTSWLLPMSFPKSPPPTWKSQVTIKDIGNTNGKAGTAKDSQGTFELTVDAASSSDATFKWSIENPLSADVDARQQIRSSFQEFLQQLDTLEDGGVLAPGGCRIAALTASENIPVMLNAVQSNPSKGLIFEPLFFRFGLEPSQINLLPGMRLRVECAPFQYVPPAISMFNGYAGSGQTVYTIAARQSDRKLTFDPFMSGLGALMVDRDDPAFASGAIDFQQDNLAMRHYRLFYPNPFPASSDQTAAYQRRVVLAGSDSLNALDNSYPEPPPTGVIYTIFRGRATATPEIQVWLNDVSTYVPIGTTLRQILTSGTNWDLYMMYMAYKGYKSAPKVLYVQRFWGRFEQISNDGLRQLLPLPIQFKPLNNKVTPDSALFDLPVMPGDMIRWQTPTG